MSKKLLLTPGPTNIPQDLLDVMGKDIIHHRTPEFRDKMKDINENLKLAFKTKSDVYTMTSSGTGAMEAAVVNFFSTGDKVIVLNTGYFGERFKKIAKIYGLDVLELEYNFGEAYKIKDVQELLANNDNIKGIFVTHSETSTGVLNDVESLGKITNGTDMLLVVDTISGLVANPFDFDGWNIDVAVAGSQKAFLIPPGLSFIAMSEKAEKAYTNSNLPKYYFDIKQYKKYFEESYETPYTPAIGLILALHKSLENMLAFGIDNITKEKYELRKYIENKATKLGFELLVKNEENRSNTLISVVKEGIEIKKIINNLENVGYTVTGGKGTYANSLMRIGILGQISTQEIDDFFVILEEELKK